MAVGIRVRSGWVMVNANFKTIVDFCDFFGTVFVMAGIDSGLDRPVALAHKTGIKEKVPLMP